MLEPCAGKLACTVLRGRDGGDAVLLTDLDVGGAVGKGEHGVKVYFVSKVEKTTDTDEVRHVPFLKEYTVFNVAQCHGLPEECLTGEVTALNLDERNADAQDFITLTAISAR